LKAMETLEYPRCRLYYVWSLSLLTTSKSKGFKVATADEKSASSGISGFTRLI
jgi:hypothetical protein